MTPTRITLIDDHAEFRDLLAQLRSEIGHEVNALSGLARRSRRSRGPVLAS